MIRFIDLGKQIGLDNEWLREFAFFNTCSCKFEVFNDSQVWDCWQDFEDDFSIQQKITGETEEISRYKRLCSDWVLKANNPEEGE